MQVLTGNQTRCADILPKRVKHTGNIKRGHSQGFNSAAPVSSKRVQRKGNVKHEHPRNLGPIRPKTPLGQVGHPGPSANLLPDLLPVRKTTGSDLVRILGALPTSPGY